MDVTTQAEHLVREVVENEGCELIHIEFKPRGTSSKLRIYIDKAGGVNLEECQRVSQHVGVVLDVEDLVSHPYVLEVSSPGIERPLFKETDYQHFAGRQIRLTTVHKIQGRRTFNGFIQKTSGGMVHLECSQETVSIPLKKISKANLVFRFR